MAHTRSSASIGRLEDNIGFLATRFSWHAVRHANHALTPLGLKTRPYALLELATSSAGISQKEIGRLMCLDASAVVALIDGLQEQGLVTRRQDPSDRRRSLIAATPQGAELAAVAADAVQEAYAGMLEALTAREREIVGPALLKLAMREDS